MVSPEVAKLLDKRTKIKTTPGIITMYFYGKDTNAALAALRKWESDQLAAGHKARRIFVEIENWFDWSFPENVPANERVMITQNYSVS